MNNNLSNTLAYKQYVLDEIAKVGGSSVQPDWNQNDSTAADYVKNRPFYEEIGEVAMLDNVVMDCSSSPMFQISDFPYEFTEGDTYTVTVNGTEYSCVAYMLSSNGITIPVVGNAALIDLTGGNGEPFLAYALSGTFECMHSATGTYTVSIAGSVSTVHELDEKFIPYIAGRNVTGQTFTVTDRDGNESEVVAGVFAESFNLANAATGECSHAEGYYTTATGSSSHAEGFNTTASGDNGSHAEGELTTASGGSSHAEGYNTTASGGSSHAEGSNTTASGIISHAEGSHTIAASSYQHAQGKFNIEDSAGTYAHIVGNGTLSARSNAHTLDWEGNAWFQGTIEGTSLILPSSTEGSTKRFKITIDDTGTLTITELVVETVEEGE